MSDMKVDDENDSSTKPKASFPPVYEDPSVPPAFVRHSSQVRYAATSLATLYPALVKHLEQLESRGGGLCSFKHSWLNEFIS